MTRDTRWSCRWRSGAGAAAVPGTAVEAAIYYAAAVACAPRPARPAPLAPSAALSAKGVLPWRRAAPLLTVSSLSPSSPPLWAQPTRPNRMTP